MRTITTSNTYLPFLCHALEYTASPLAVCIVCAEADGTPVAGAIFDGYNGQIIHGHMWLDAEKTPMREWYSVICDYPFNQLRVHKVIGQVRSKNLEAVKLDLHLGYELEGEIANYFDDDSSLLVFTMTKEQCRILNSPVWANVNKRIQRAK